MPPPLREYPCLGDLPTALVSRRFAPYDGRLVPASPLMKTPAFLPCNETEVYYATYTFFHHLSFFDKFVYKVLNPDQDPNVRKYVEAAKAKIKSHIFTLLYLGSRYRFFWVESRSISI